MNKKILKSMKDQMEPSEKTINELYDKIQTQGNKRYRGYGYIASASICVCLLLMLVMYNRMFKNIDTNLSYSNSEITKRDSQEYHDIKKENSQKHYKNKIIFNDLNLVSSNKASREDGISYEAKINYHQALEYYGIGIKQEDLPEGLIDDNIDRTYLIYYDKNQKIKDDTNAFIFSEPNISDEYNPLRRNLSIVVSKDEISRDCIYIEDNELKKSLINDVEIILGHTLMSYGPYNPKKKTADGRNEPAGYYDLFQAEFIYNDIYYHIISENLNKAEFIDVVGKIILTSIEPNNSVNFEKNMVEYYSNITKEKAYSIEKLSEHLPKTIIDNMIYSYGQVEMSTNKMDSRLYLSFNNGKMGYMSIKVEHFRESDKEQLISISEVRKYDITKYSPPYAETIPNELAKTMDRPIFDINEITEEVINLRKVIRKGDQGDSEYYEMMNFAIKCGDYVVDYNIKVDKININGVMTMIKS